MKRLVVITATILVDDERDKVYDESIQVEGVVGDIKDYVTWAINHSDYGDEGPLEVYYNSVTVLPIPNADYVSMEEFCRLHGIE